jgi:hypothetical protein
MDQMASTRPNGQALKGPGRRQKTASGKAQTNHGLWTQGVTSHHGRDGD